MKFNQSKVLCVDDQWKEIGLDEFLVKPFKEHHIVIEFESDKDKVLPKLEQERNIDAILLDLKLPDKVEQGIEILKRIENLYDIPVVILTSVSDVKTAVSCIEMGAYNYFVKDEVKPNQLAITVKQAIELRELKAKGRKFEKIIGENVDIPDDAKLVVRNISKVFKSNREVVEAIKNANIGAREEEFMVILGPSGCGKSTLLRIIAGLEKPTTGNVYLDGKEIKGTARERGMVFQQYTSFPWLTVEKNIEFGLRLRKMPEQEIKEISQHYLEAVGLKGFKDVYPKELSGGMQQRVAIARILANEPKIILMDEPFGALDAQTRWVMQELLLKVWRELKCIVIFVTHDVEEALYLGDRIYVSTARPSALKYEIKVPFERPRALRLKTSENFTDLERTILELIRKQAMK